MAQFLLIIRTQQGEVGGIDDALHRKCV